MNDIQFGHWRALMADNFVGYVRLLTGHFSKYVSIDVTDQTKIQNKQVKN